MVAEVQYYKIPDMVRHKNCQRWQAQLSCKLSLELGEGPIWHHQWKKFLFLSIGEPFLYIWDPVAGKLSQKQIPLRATALSMTDRSTLVLAGAGSLMEFDPYSNHTRLLCSFEPTRRHYRTNDGKTDADGRFWFGTMQSDGKGEEGNLYQYDGNLQTCLSGLKVPNGLCWDETGNTLYFIDSFQYRIQAFDCCKGRLSGARTIVDDFSSAYIPDGMTIDSEGMLWVAIWGGGCVNRYNPFTGAIIGQVAVDAPQVSSCCFGGDELTCLFITTARTGMTEQELSMAPLSGSVFELETGVKGIKTNLFRTNYHNAFRAY